MKSCVVRKRIQNSAGFTESGIATTIDLEPGFGIPKACIIYYLDNNQTEYSTDISTQFRTVGIGFIGSTDSTITSNLTQRSVYTTQMDGVAATGGTIVRRQNNLTRGVFTNTTGGSTWWQVTTATFSTDQITLNTSGSAAPTNVHLDCIVTAFGGNDLIVGVGNTIYPSTAGTGLSLSTLNFQPDVVFVASSITTAGQGLTDDGRIAWGCATRSPSLQKGIYWHNETPVTTVQVSSISSSNCLTTYWTNTGVGPYTFGMGPIYFGGFATTAGATVPSTLQAYNYLAMTTGNPSDFALLDLATYTSTGSSFIGTGTSGFVPYTVIGGMVGCTTDNTRHTNVASSSDGITLFAGYRSPHSVFYNGVGTLSVTSGNATVTGSGTEFGRLCAGTQIYDSNGSLAGEVSTVSSKTGISLRSTSLISITSASYLYTNPNQYAIAFGNSSSAATVNVWGGIGQTLLTYIRGFGLGTSFVEIGRADRDDTRPGLITNTLTSSGQSRRGWILAIRDDSYGRRRGGIF